MREVARIKAAYDWMIQQYNAGIGSAVAAGNQAAISQLEEVRDALERGVFVLLFSQFESEVSAHFDRARTRRVGNVDWTQRRGWDVPLYASRKVPFDTKLALVLDRNTDAYGQILDAYAKRNHCAHGGMTLSIGSIDRFITDIRNWARQLRS